jgi:acyl-homoserine-lactone acylase
MAAANKDKLVPISYGSSHIQAVSVLDAGRVLARTILTYSQSTDPTNPHYADQTALFSKKRWVVDRFCRSAIAASPVKQVKHLVG